MVRSDRLFATDWRVAELERADVLTDDDRDWLLLVVRSWIVWVAEDGGGPIEFVWGSVAARARRVLARSVYR